MFFKVTWVKKFHTENAQMRCWKMNVMCIKLHRVKWHSSGSILSNYPLTTLLKDSSNMKTKSLFSCLFFLWSHWVLKFMFWLISEFKFDSLLLLLIKNPLYSLKLKENAVLVSVLKPTQTRLYKTTSHLKRTLDLYSISSPHEPVATFKNHPVHYRKQTSCGRGGKDIEIEKESKQNKKETGLVFFFFFLQVKKKSSLADLQHSKKISLQS